MNNLEKILDDSIAKVKDFPKKGILFYDITSILLKPSVFNLIIENIYEYYANSSIDGIVAVESRGFIFAAPLALKFNEPLILARKKGKLPRQTVSESYTLEYGEETIEVHKDDILKEKRYLLIDDLIATGGTLKAIANLVENSGATVAGIAAVIGLPFLNYNKLLGKYDVKTLINYHGE